MKNKLIILIGIIAILLFLFSQKTKGSKELIEIKVKDIPVKVMIAGTPTTRQRGLGGVKNLGKDEGMLFVFPQKEVQVFWMKDMYISLDMIWITDNKIANITKNIPAPAPHERDNPMPRYSSQIPVDYVYWK
jgi:uncharacterized membrane protein (UPF0127 family)